MPNTFPYQLTAINQNSRFIHIHERERIITAAFEHDGDENYQLHHLPLSGGKPVPFDKDENMSVCYHACTGNHEIYYSSNHENPLLNIYRLNLKTNSKELLQSGKEAPIVVEAVSPNGSDYVFTETYTNTHSVGFYQAHDKKTPLVPDPSSPHVIRDVRFADEDKIYFLTNYQEEFSYLASFTLSTNEFRQVQKLKDEEIKMFTSNGTTFYLASEKGVKDHLYQFETTTGELASIDLPCDILKKIDASSNGALYALGISSHRIDNIFKREVNGEWLMLTNNKALGIDERQMIKPEVIRYPSYDGLSIEALLFKPDPDFVKSGTILWLHGGPQQAERMKYRPLIQYLVQSGYTIFSPNFRGSTGYGATFQKMVEKDWGGGPRHDCVAGMEWLIENGHARKGKIAVMGGSYGGYLSLLLAGRHGEYLGGVIDIFGISNLLTFVENVPSSWRSLTAQMVGNPVKDYDKLVEASPITYVEQMNKPMFILHGKNDPRVKTEESERIAEKMKEKEIFFEYLYFEDEGHGFSKKKNEMEANKRIRIFLDRIFE
ncbi:prolyl oligopeptidase family serine peptidase [Lysinibacillus sphaericus]